MICGCSCPPKLRTLQASALAGFSFITVPFAIAIGGLAVAAFAIGPGLLNSKVRNLGGQLQPVESAEAEAAPTRSLSSTPADD